MFPFLSNNNDMEEYKKFLISQSSSNFVLLWFSPSSSSTLHILTACQSRTNSRKNEHRSKWHCSNLLHKLFANWYYWNCIIFCNTLCDCLLLATNPAQQIISFPNHSRRVGVKRIEDRGFWKCSNINYNLVIQPNLWILIPGNKSFAWNTWSIVWLLHSHSPRQLMKSSYNSSCAEGQKCFRTELHLMHQNHVKATAAAANYSHKYNTRTRAVFE